MTQTLIEKARALTKSIAEEKETKRIAQEKADREWEENHALDMIDSLKGELVDQVLKAAAKGEKGTYLSVYAWSNHGRPKWVNLFLTPFEKYLDDEGFMWEFVEDETNSDTDMPRNDSGGYRLDW